MAKSSGKSVVPIILIIVGLEVISAFGFIEHDSTWAFLTMVGVAALVQISCLILVWYIFRLMIGLGNDLKRISESCAPPPEDDTVNEDPQNS